MAHMLSYAGRLQLIRSILTSMQNYWAHIFPLPKKLIKAVEMVCRRFLWTGKTLDSKKAPVTWHTFFLPKIAGGWNLINMTNWNQAAQLKLIWAIESEADELWVKWVAAYYLKQTTPLNVVITNNISWILRKIIKAREALEDIGGWEQTLHNGQFSIKKTYKCLQGAFDPVRWRKVICNNKASPRSIYILWLALRNRLATCDRISKWMPSCNVVCCLCNVEMEYVQHLFLSVQFFSWYLGSSDATDETNI